MCSYLWTWAVRHIDSRTIILTVELLFWTLLDYDKLFLHINHVPLWTIKVYHISKWLVCYLHVHLVLFWVFLILKSLWIWAQLFAKLLCRNLCKLVYLKLDNVMNVSLKRSTYLFHAFLKFECHFKVSRLWINSCFSYNHSSDLNIYVTFSFYFKCLIKHNHVLQCRSHDV